MLKMTWRGLYLSSKFMKNRFYLPISFQWTQNLHCWSKTRTKTVSGDSHHTNGHADQWLCPLQYNFQSPITYSTPQSMSASVPQVACNFLFCAQMLASVSCKCISSDAQVARRCTQVTQLAPILTSVSQVYHRCITGMSQLYRNSLATLTSGKWISLHTIQLSAHMALKFDSVWKVIIWSVIITQFQCCKIFELQSFPFHLVTLKMVLVSQYPITGMFWFREASLNVRWDLEITQQRHFSHSSSSDQITSTLRNQPWPQNPTQGLDCSHIQKIQTKEVTRQLNSFCLTPVESFITHAQSYLCLQK